MIDAHDSDSENHSDASRSLASFSHSWTCSWTLPCQISLEPCSSSLGLLT